jgi:hypothetical protein
MWLPRLRFKLRQLMLLVAVIAVALGVIETVRMRRLRASYLEYAIKFSRMENLEREQEQHFARIADMEEAWLEDSAREARFSRRSISDIRNRHQFAARYPGQPGGYNDPDGDLLLDLLTLTELRATEVRHKEQAAWYRSEAAASSRRANHFDFLRTKYENAAARPWMSVGPDEKSSPE